MKKLFVLLVLVVAMVAAPVFAEVSGTSYEGDFRYKVGGDFSSSTQTSTGDQDLDLILDAHVGEFTTFSVEIQADPDNDTSGVVDGGLLNIDDITMTQDFGSMYGLDLTLKMTAGTFDFSPTEYEDMMDFEFIHPSDQDAIQFEVGTAGLTATVWLAPVELASEANVFAAKVVYESDMANVAANYVRFGEGATRQITLAGQDIGTPIPAVDNKGNISASAKILPVEGVTVYGSVEADLDVELNMFGFGAAYTMDALTVEAAFEAFVCDNSDYAIDIAIDDSGVLGLGVAYDVTDSVTAKAGAYYPLNEDIDMVFDAGVVFDVDTVEYCLGVSYAPSTNVAPGIDLAWDETYVAPYSAAGFGEDFAVSFQMDVDF